MIMQSSAQWLKENEIDQWSDFLEGQGELILARRFKEGRLLLDHVAGRDCACVTLQDEDSFWAEQAANALYIHSMAVVRSFAGKAIGISLLNFAYQAAARNQRQFLRLDCMANNRKLCAYYESAGFKPKGEMAWGRHLVRLYERPVET